MSKAERTKKTEITTAVRKKVYERDGGECIFCQMGYRAASEKKYPKDGYFGRQVMHFIPRSQGGLGVEENLATGCVLHHRLYDEGAHGEPKEMKPFFEDYLRSIYKDWNPKKLVYNKWEALEIE